MAPSIFICLYIYIYICVCVCVCAYMRVCVFAGGIHHVLCTNLLLGILYNYLL